MKLLDMARAMFSRRSADEKPVDWWARFADAFTVKSAQRVNNTTALQTTAVFACVRVISEGVAQVPLTLLRRGSGAPDTWHEVELGHLLARLMRKPNPWMTGFEFRETLTIHAALTGNGFAFKNRDAGGRVAELIPILPDRVCIKQAEDYVVAYDVRTSDGKVNTIPARDMLHLRGPSWDAVSGMSAVKLAREAIGLALATEESHARLHANGVRLAGVLTSPQALGPDAAKRIAQDWKDAYGSTGNWYKTPVLEGGMDFKALGQTALDAQHLETRRYQIEEICRAFRVWPQMVMQSDKTSTFASAEQFFLAHITYTLGPWIRRWEDRLDTHILTPDNYSSLWFHFDLRGLAPGDAIARSRYYSTLVNGGIMTPNEARRGEGLNPIAGGDTLRVPVNLAPVDEKPDDEKPAPKEENE